MNNNILNHLYFCIQFHLLYLLLKLIIVTNLKMSESGKFPAVFIPHGGGPMPILGDKSHSYMVEWLGSFAKNYLEPLVTPLKAIVVFSAHWEEMNPTVLSAPAPGLLFDYYNFPPESYKLSYPAQNNLELVHKIKSLIEASGMKCNLDEKRGYDHGVFIPLLLMFPKPTVPVIQVSILKDLDPKRHFDLGAALSPLRNEGVFFIGSGMSYHGNLREDDAVKSSQLFHSYLREALLEDESQVKLRKILEWKNGPQALNCHPREEHLIPLMVILGIAGTQAPVHEAFYKEVMNVPSAGYIFE